MRKYIFNLACHFKQQKKYNCYINDPIHNKTYSRMSCFAYINHCMESQIADMASKIAVWEYNGQSRNASLEARPGAVSRNVHRLHRLLRLHIKTLRYIE